MEGGQLLIVWHSRTGTAEALARAVADGAGERAQLLHCSQVGPEELIAATGYLFTCPENLASMTGAMKEMFDRCYYPVLGRIEGRPYTSVIAAGSDGEGAQRQLDRIATGWRLRKAMDGWIVITHAQSAEEILAQKTVPQATLEKAREIGQALAEGIALGIY
ncbi:flavodoxin family protein [Qipengyuania soli]|uniref:Flavodoxin family protein n=1 Tax=Qipengyuania soli TaxID=2782568 RepID=A0A7S8F5Z7_9SPHN|nr:flavodoxin family protein [Qipengyuania soli]QPC99869.1 flavodoxin family protein [Qipengyuania soli]